MYERLLCQWPIEDECVRGPPVGEPATQPRALRGRGLDAREAGGRHRPSRPSDHPIQPVPPARESQARREQIDEASSLSVALGGTSPATGPEERLRVVTSALVKWGATEEVASDWRAEDGGMFAVCRKESGGSPDGREADAVETTLGGSPERRLGLRPPWRSRTRQRRALGACWLVSCCCTDQRPPPGQSVDSLPRTRGGDNGPGID